MDYFENERNFKISKKYEGIYYIEGETFPIQIVEQKKLSSNENLFVKNLSSVVSKDDIKDIIKLHKKGMFGDKSTYLDTVIRANFETFKEAIKMNMSEEFIEMFTEAALEYGWMDEILEQEASQAKYSVAKKLLAKGMSPEEVSELTELSLEQIMTAQ